MNADSRNTVLVAQVFATSDRLGTCLAEATALLAELWDSLSGGLQSSIEQPLKPPSTRDEIHAADRRAHKSGVLPKVASDPELQEFILERVDTLNFQQIVTAVADAFPPHRRVSLSSIDRRWRRTGKALTAARL